MSTTRRCVAVSQMQRRYASSERPACRMLGIECTARVQTAGETSSVCVGLQPFTVWGLRMTQADHLRTVFGGRVNHSEAGSLVSFHDTLARRRVAVRPQSFVRAEVCLHARRVDHRTRDDAVYQEHREH